MKKYMPIGMILLASNLSFAASTQKLGCYSGALYRAMNGKSVAVAADGTKTVSVGDKVLLQCSVGGNQCSAEYNNYSCSVNFASVEGIEAKQVHDAIQGQTVRLGTTMVEQQKCQNMHCVESTELNCESDQKCTVDVHFTGWDE